MIILLAFTLVIFALLPYYYTIEFVDNNNDNNIIVAMFSYSRFIIGLVISTICFFMYSYIQAFQGQWTLLVVSDTFRTAVAWRNDPRTRNPPEIYVCDLMVRVVVIDATLVSRVHGKVRWSPSSGPVSS